MALDLTQGREWMAHGRCGPERDRYFFAERTSRMRQREQGTMLRSRAASPTKLVGAERIAVATCSICPVQRECLGYALRNGVIRSVRKVQAADPRVPDGGEEWASEYDLHGVWGGTLQAERRGKTEADLDELLAFARARAIREGLAPPEAA